MRLVRQMKSMKDMVNSAPELIAQTQQLGAQAQALAEAQRAVAVSNAQAGSDAFTNSTAEPAEGHGLDFEPIAGVSLQLYAEISRALAGSAGEPSQAQSVAASRGVSAESWSVAMDGWNQRMKLSPGVARQFNQHYTAV